MKIVKSVFIIAALVAGGSTCYSLGLHDAEPVAIEREVQVEVVREVVRKVEVPAAAPVQTVGPRDCRDVFTSAKRVQDAGDIVSRLAGEHVNIMSEAGQAIYMKDMVAINKQARRNVVTRGDMSQAFRDINGALDNLENAIERCK